MHDLRVSSLRYDVGLKQEAEITTSAPGKKEKSREWISTRAAIWLERSAVVACPQAPSLRGDLSSQPSCLPPFFFYGRVIIIYSSSIGTRNIAHATLCIRSQIENVCGRRNCYNVSCTAQPVVDCVYSRMLNRVCTYIHIHKEFEPCWFSSTY